MNVCDPQKLVVLGFVSHFPVAGVAWQTLHYLEGFRRLGFEVYYVEAHGCTPSKLMQSATDDGGARAAAYISGLMERFGFGAHWAYHELYPFPRFFGLTESALTRLYADAALIINLHGSHLPSPELSRTNRLVYLETDPVDIQIALHRQDRETRDYLAPHCAFFSFGERFGAPDCKVPVSREFRFRPTRQPVVMDFWEDCGREPADTFTTIGNWRQPWREVELGGEVYRWSKHYEFLKFIDLPRRVEQSFELALSSYDADDQRLLEAAGWRVRRAIDFSQDLDAYRAYIGASRGEFTVAKDQNVRLRSGWFSDRAVTYLAAGRPVITQETGFTGILPTGAGLLGFSTMDELVGAVAAVNGDYERHRRAALDVARECFRHDVVLGRMLDELGVSFSRGRIGRSAVAPSPVLPAGLVLAPRSRWPTRLPEETLRTALALPLPVVPPAPAGAAHPAEGVGGVRSGGASIIIVTHNGLAYTKMCLASLLLEGWHPGDELLVVDNASTDGTVEFLGELMRRNPCVRVIFNGHNRGFAAANNQALAVAAGGVVILLNNDTIVTPGWRDGLMRRLEDGNTGMVGPVTNRTCNEAQIDAPYRTHGELLEFARERAGRHAGGDTAVAMLAMYCVALRAVVVAEVGSLDEGFAVGMFEDDDYALRVRQAGYRVTCAEDVFVHHFGQASLGELCVTGDYDRIFEANRRRFERKWGMEWQPHRRRITPEYEDLRRRIRDMVAARLPPGATVLIVSKGDDELLRLGGAVGWHFPQGERGEYAGIYPPDSAVAIDHLESLRSKGAGYLLIPRPGFWWLEHYGGLREHLEQRHRVALRDDETCVIFELEGGGHDG